MLSTATYSDILGADPFQKMITLWVQRKALVGTMQQSSEKLQGFSTLKSLTFDQNISSTTCDETNSTYLYNLTYLINKILPEFEFKVNFSRQS